MTLFIAYLFQPIESGSLNYTMIWSNFYQGYTVGGSSIADIDGDGFVEIIVAIYEANKCDVFTLAPKFK